MSNLFRIKVESVDSGQVQIITCTKNTLTIGSAPENDLVLTDPHIQSRHARIEFHRNNVLFRVIGSDKRTSEDTQAADIRDEELLTNVPERIGEAHYITLLDGNRGKKIAVTASPRQQQSGRWPSWNSLSVQTVTMSVKKLLSVRRLLLLVLGGTLLVSSLGILSTRLLGSERPASFISKRVSSLFNFATTGATVTPTGNANSFVITTTPDAPATQILTATPTGTPTRAVIPAVAIVVTQSLGFVDGPTPIPVPTVTPTATSVGPDQILVTVTPTEIPTATPLPTVSPVDVIALSDVLQQLRVWIDPAIVPIGQPYWRLVEAQWLSEEESQGRNYIFVEVVNASGVRPEPTPDVLFSWKDGSIPLSINKPPETGYGLDFLMNATGNSYNVSIEGSPSDTIRGLGMGTVENPSGYTKTSFFLKFQETIRKQ